MARPIRGTNPLVGTSQSDKLQGSSDDDLIIGGGGNDSINGGSGIDTAVFTGNYADYNFISKPTGNHKITVIDTVAGRDGTDDLKSVEWLKFNDATYNVLTGELATWDYSVNDTPDVSAQDPASPGNLYTGTGIPAVNFGIARNEDAGVELGLQVIYRQGPSVASTDANGYDDGVLDFQVNDGPQSTTNGSFGNNANRAAWNFEYSIATGLNGETTSLDDFTFKLLYDVDPTANVSYKTLTLEAETTAQAAGQSGFQWRDQDTGFVFISDDEGTANVTQNSENYAFTFFQAFLTDTYGPTNSFSGPAQFDIQLQAFDGAQMIAQNHISVDVIV
jgi:hypothetical protein